MPRELRLKLLGKPHASEDGTAIATFVYNKALALLCYLATTGRPHSREALAGLLWGEMTDDHARANLRKILLYLRKAVPEHTVIARQTVAFNCESPHWLDVEVFESKLRSLPSGDEPAVLNEMDARVLEETVELYGGDFLEGFYVHDAPAFEEWVLIQRERLRKLALYALHSLARYNTARGYYAAGIDYTARLLALEPWQEEFHQQMMLLLALSGQRSGSLHQYEVCRNILSRELGVEPSADTVLLFQQVQAGKVTIPPPPPIPRHDLAAQMTPVIGRDEELQLIVNHLRRPECRLLTLTGISGVGKTSLALQAASDMQSAFADGVYVVHPPPESYPDGLIQGIGESLGLPCKGQPGLMVCLLDYLRTRRVLLVLDQADHSLDSLEALVQILQQAPGVRLLATSLRRLGLAGEWVLPVRGLRYPEDELATDAGNYSAVRLFADRARRLQSGFGLAEAEMSAVVRICRLVEGLPLALELAADWVRALTCDEIAAEIEKNTDFLATTSLLVPERHRSLRAAFGYCWEQLADEEQAALKRLSVFLGGFCRDAAEQVANTSLTILAGLLDRGLLQSGPSGRYHLQRLLRPYGTERLAEDPAQSAETYDRLCAYYSSFLEQKGTQLRGPGRRQALDEFAAEMDNIKVAWTWASRQPALEPVDDRPGELAESAQLRVRFEGARQALPATLRRAVTLADRQ